nr:hypothetical protein [Pseudomonadota bacterium]
HPLTQVSCFLTLANYLTARSQQQQSVPFDKSEDASICQILADSMQNISQELAFSEIVFWLKNPPKNKDFTEGVLKRLQNFLRLPIGSNETKEAYIDRMAMALVLSIDNTEFDERLEYRILALMHAQKTGEILSLPRAFTLNQNDYLLSAIHSDRQNYLRAMQRVCHLILDNNLNFDNMTKKFTFLVTQFLQKQFEVNNLNEKEIGQSLNISCEVLRTLAECKIPLPTGLMTTLLQIFLKADCYRLAISNQDKIFVLDFARSLGPKPEFAAFLNTLTYNELLHFIGNAADIFHDNIASYLPSLAEPTIQNIMNVVAKTTETFEYFTLALIKAIGQAKDKNLYTEQLHFALTHLISAMQLNDDSILYYLYLMQEIRNSMFIIQPNQDVATADFNTTLYKSYLTLADGLLAVEKYRAETLDEMEVALRLFCEATVGEHGDAFFIALLTRGVNPIGKAPNTVPASLINIKNFDRLNLLLQFSKANSGKIQLHECGPLNLILLALTRGADSITIQLMLDCDFPLPKLGISAHCKQFNIEAFALLYEHAVRASDAPTAELSIHHNGI